MAWTWCFFGLLLILVVIKSISRPLHDVKVDGDTASLPSETKADEAGLCIPRRPEGRKVLLSDVMVFVDTRSTAGPGLKTRY